MSLTVNTVVSRRPRYGGVLPHVKIVALLHLSLCIYVKGLYEKGVRAVLRNKSESRPSFQNVPEEEWVSLEVEQSAPVLVFSLDATCFRLTPPLRVGR